MSEERLLKYAQWIVSNEDKRGTPDFSKVASAFKQLQSELSPDAPLGSEEWKTQQQMLGLDVGDEPGFPAPVTTPAGAARARQQGLDIGETPTRPVPQLPPVAGTETNVPVPFTEMDIPLGGGPNALLRGAMRTGGALVAGREQAEQTFKRPEDASLVEKGAEMVGEMAPYAAIPGELVASPLNAAAAGGIVGALEAGPEASLGEVAQEAGVGAGFGLVGQQAGLAAQKGIQGLRPGAKDLTERMMQRAEDLGFKRTRGQLPGAKRSTQRREARSIANASTTDSYANIAENNQKLGNELAGRQLGLDGIDTLPAERLGEAAENTGRLYDQALTGETILITDDVLDSLAAIEAVSSVELSKDRQKLVKKFTDEIMELSDNNSLTGELYNDIRSRMAKPMRRLYNSKENADFMQAEALENLQSVLDDAAEAALSGDKVALLKEARKRWYWQLQMERPGVVNGRGDVSLARLHNNLNKKSTSYRRGGTNNDLEVATRFSAANRPMPTSGTSERMLSKGGLIRTALGKVESPIMAQTAGQRFQQAAPSLPGVGARAALMQGPLSESELAKSLDPELSPLNRFRRNF